MTDTTIRVNEPDYRAGYRAGVEAAGLLIEAPDMSIIANYESALRLERSRLADRDAEIERLRNEITVAMGMVNDLLQEREELRWQICRP